MLHSEYLYNYEKVRISESTRSNEVEINNKAQGSNANYFSLRYIYGGEATCYIENMKFDLPENSIVFLSKHTLWNIVPKKNNTVKSINIDFKDELFYEFSHKENSVEEVIKNISGTKEGVKFSFPKDFYYHDEDGYLKRVFEEALNEYRNRKAQYHEVLKNSIHIILIKIMRSFEEFQKKKNGADLVQDILDYTQMNEHKRITVSMLAKHFNYSESYIIQKFKKEMGVSYPEYLRQRKILLSVKMLERGETVQNAAERVGFSDVKSYVRCFKKYIGVAPNVYKKERNKLTFWYDDPKDLKEQVKY